MAKGSFGRLITSTGATTYSPSGSARRRRDAVGACCNPSREARKRNARSLRSARWTGTRIGYGDDLASGAGMRSAAPPPVRGESRKISSRARSPRVSPCPQAPSTRSWALSRSIPRLRPNCARQLPFAARSISVPTATRRCSRRGWRPKSSTFPVCVVAGSVPSWLPGENAADDRRPLAEIATCEWPVATRPNRTGAKPRGAVDN
jgi:hypothetical protein